MKTYGYCRVSTHKQKIERQTENIKREYPDAILFCEEYTGTTVNRPEWQKLLRLVKTGDKIVFDEVSRMSRDAKEGFAQYTELFERGIELVFLKEPHINTSVYKKALETELEATGNEIADCYIEATNKVLKILQRQQIELAFEQAQKERDNLSRRTSEGVRRAQAQGKQVGREQGRSYETKKSKAIKEIIKKHSKDFGGSLGDADCMKLAQCARNTYYKCKREIKEES